MKETIPTYLEEVLPWPEGKSMYQLDERGVMFSTNELRQVVPELQRRVAALEALVMKFMSK